MKERKIGKSWIECGVLLLLCICIPLCLAKFLSMDVGKLLNLIKFALQVRVHDFV